MTADPYIYAIFVYMEKKHHIYKTIPSSDIVSVSSRRETKAITEFAILNYRVHVCLLLHSRKTVKC